MHKFKNTDIKGELDFLSNSSLDDTDQNSDESDDDNEQMFTKKHKFKKLVRHSKERESSQPSSKHSTPRKNSEEFKKSLESKPVSKFSKSSLKENWNSSGRNVLNKLKRETSDDSDDKFDSSQKGTRKNLSDSRNASTSSRKSSVHDLHQERSDSKRNKETWPDSKRDSVVLSYFESTAASLKENRTLLDKSDKELKITKNTVDPEKQRSSIESNRRKSSTGSNSSDQSNTSDANNHNSKKLVEGKARNKLRARESSADSDGSSSRERNVRRSSGSSGDNRSRSSSTYHLEVTHNDNDDSSRSKNKKDKHGFNSRGQSSSEGLSPPRKSILKKKHSSQEVAVSSEDVSGGRREDSKNYSSYSDGSASRSSMREHCQKNASNNRSEDVLETQLNLLDDVTCHEIKEVQEGQKIVTEDVYKVRNNSRLKGTPPSHHKLTAAATLRDVKSKYRVDLPRPVDLGEANSQEVIRYMIFNEWNMMASRRLKKMKDDERLKKEHEERMKQEKEEKLKEAMANFKAWKKIKRRATEEKRNKKREDEEKERREREEMMQRKKDGERMFRKWKESKDDILREAIKQKVKEKLMQENKEKKNGRDKKEESEKLFKAWKNQKDSLLIKSARKMKEQEKKEFEMKQRETDTKESMAMTSYLQWCEKKIQQEQEEEYKSQLKKYSGYHGDRKPWRPSSSSLHTSMKPFRL